MFSELKENISDQWQREEKQNKGGAVLVEKSVELNLGFVKDTSKEVVPLMVSKALFE